MLRDLIVTLQDLKEVREEVAFVRKSGIFFNDLVVGYETVIEDVLRLTGLTERQIDLIWEITEPEKQD